MILPISAKNDFNSIMAKWLVRMTELLKEEELSNFSTFINHTSQLQTWVIYSVIHKDPKEFIFVTLLNSLSIKLLIQ